MSESGTENLPASYQEAAAVLTPLFKAQVVPATDGSQTTLSNITEVKVLRGINIRNQGPKSTDTIEITAKNADFAKSSEYAQKAGMALLGELNKIDAVKNEVVLVPQAEYLTGIKEEMGALLGEAQKLGIPASNLDFKSWKGLDPQYPEMQVPDYAARISENPGETSVRIQVPTNNQKPGEALKEAEAMAKVLESKLPDIQKRMIKRIQEKNYIPNLTPELIQQLEAHKFDVSVQQQEGNWTSIFINIRSPKQQQAHANPAEKHDPAELKKSNMLSMIPDEKTRSKLATRAVLFDGKGPEEMFLKVAGTQNMEDMLGKIMYHLVKAKPDLAPRAEALLKENVFKKRINWNVSNDLQQQQKLPASASIDPEHTDTLKLYLPVPAGKSDEIVGKIAALGNKAAVSSPAEMGASEQVVASTPAIPAAPTMAATDTVTAPGMAAASSVAAGPDAAAASEAATVSVAAKLGIEPKGSAADETLAGGATLSFAAAKAEADAAKKAEKPTRGAA